MWNSCVRGDCFGSVSVGHVSPWTPVTPVTSAPTQNNRSVNLSAALTTMTSGLTTSDDRGDTNSHFGDTALLVANMVIVVFIFCGNILTIVLIASHRALRSQNTYRFAVSLACADLLMGAIYPFYSVLNYTGETAAPLLRLHYPCAICLYCIMVSAGVSQFTLLVIAVDRYMAVLRALEYGRLAGGSKVALAVGVIWSYAGLACLTMFVVLQEDQGYPLPCSLLNELPLWYYAGVVMPHIFVPKLVSLGLYARVLRVAVKQQRQISQHSIALAPAAATASKRDRKAAKMSAILLGLFLVCWLPYLILYVCAYVSGPTSPRVIFDLLEFSKILSLSNSYMNPMVYFWKNRDFRQALSRLLGCRRGWQRWASGASGGGHVLTVSPPRSLGLSHSSLGAALSLAGNTARNK